MKSKRFIIILLCLTLILLISGVVVIITFKSKDATALGSDLVTVDTGNQVTEAPIEDKSERDLNYTYIPPTIEDIKPNPKPVNTDIPIEEEPFVPASGMDLEPASITVFVNKEYSLPQDYKPDDLVIPDIYFHMTYYDERTLMRFEAASAIERLFLAARNEGYHLSGISGYRSYARQWKIFTDNIVFKGKEHTLKYSAVPGTSEHQTGLTMDISCESLDFDLSSAFADTPEGQWVAENAYRFGFIVRYPKGKAKITGYAYEPWHIRYVGKALAAYLYDNGLTLEEYYKYKPSKDFDFETLYADLINYTPSVTPLPLGEDGVILGENGEIIDVGLGDEIELPAESEDTTPSEEPSEGADSEDADQTELPDGDSNIGDNPEDGNPSNGDDAATGDDTSDPGEATDAGDSNDSGQSQNPDDGNTGNEDPALSPTPVPTPVPPNTTP